MPKTVAVLPVKSFGRAKQRLAERVGAPQRATLAAAMVGDVLEALAAVRGLDEILVVTTEPRAVEAARAAGLRVIDDPTETGHSEAALLGVDAAVESGAERVLLVPGDCPALDPAEVGTLLERHGRAGVVIVPDRHGAGTNALLLSPPDVIEPSFGPGSFARHAARAYAREAEYTEDEALTRIVDMFEAEINRPTDMGSITPRSQQGH